MSLASLRSSQILRTNGDKTRSKNSRKRSRTNCEKRCAKGSGKRSRNNCEKLSATSNVDRQIEFTDDGTPTGDYSSNFSTYNAWLVRIRVSCAIKSWKHLDKNLKEGLWQEVKDFWNIKDDTHKKKIVKLMGERWRDWKTRLNKEYIINVDPENPKNPCDDFNISKEEWEEFKMQRASDEFKKKSAQAKEAASKNIHPHRLGSAGYKGAVAKWSKEDIILSGSSSLGISSSVDLRSWRWLRARAKLISKGVYEVPNPVTREVLERAELMAEEVSQGLFQPDRYNDILSASIGTSEHSGRLRGYSGNVSIKTIYGTGPRRTSHADCITKSDFDRSMEEALLKQKAELTSELTAQFNSQMQSFSERMNLPLALPTDVSPQQSHHDLTQAHPDDRAMGDEAETARETRKRRRNEQEENQANTVEEDIMVFNDEVILQGTDMPTNVNTPALWNQGEGSSSSKRARRNVSNDIGLKDIGSMRESESIQAIVDVITKSTSDVIKAKEVRQVEGSSSGKRTRKKVSKDSGLEDIDSMRESIQAVVDVIMKSTANVVKSQEVRQVPKSEIWKLLEELDFDEPEMDKAYIFLIKNPDMLDSILSCPSKRRRNLLIEMMKYG